MELIKLMNGIQNYKSKGEMTLDVKGIACDSRKVKPGFVFVAIRGFEADGHDFVGDAIANGAIALVLDMGADLKKVKITNKDITVIIAEDTRKALALMSCNFYGNPSSKFKLIGVTGTKGKTTTTYMIKSILEKEGHKVGLIGTIANYIGEDCLGESSRTTPESLELQQLFYKMAKEKVEYVVMEVSSQSLKLGRVDGCNFNIGLFTNLSEECQPEKDINYAYPLRNVRY